MNDVMRFLFRMMLTALPLAPTFIYGQMSDAQGMAFARDYLREHGLDSLVELQTEEVRKNLPIKQSELEQIVAVTYLRSSHTQIWKHVAAPEWLDRLAVMRGVSSGEIRQTIPGLMRDMATKMACNEELSSFLLSQGLIVQHVYFENSGAYAFTLNISYRDCGASR